MNFWLELIIKLVAILLTVLTGSLVVIYAELKAGSHMQSRIGPYDAGGRWGWAQPLADGLKFLRLSGDIRVPDGERFTACPQCGLLWSSLDAAELRGVMKKHGKPESKNQSEDEE